MIPACVSLESNRIEPCCVNILGKGKCLDILHAMRVSLIDQTLTQLQMNLSTNCNAPLNYLQTKFTITIQLSSQVNVGCML